MKTILVDASSVLVPIALAQGDFELCTSKGVQTTYTYSFLQEILTFGNLFKSNRFIIVFDSKTNLRKNIFPEYKAKRKEKSPEIAERLNKLYSEIPSLRDVLTKIGFHCISLDGYESDDIIASYIKSNQDISFIIISSDHDMYQLMSERVEIYKPNKGRFFSLSDFNEKYPDLSPSDYWKILSISGCRTDEVPSITGDKTAYKFVMNKLKKESKAYQAIIKGKDTVKFVRRLVQLPFEGTPEYIVPDFKLNKVEFFNICQELEFNYFLEKEFVTWCGFFSMRGA